MRCPHRLGCLDSLSQECFTTIPNRFAWSPSSVACESNSFLMRLFGVFSRKLKNLPLASVTASGEYRRVGVERYKLVLSKPRFGSQRISFSSCSLLASWFLLPLRATDQLSVQFFVLREAGILAQIQSCLHCCVHLIEIERLSVRTFGRLCNEVYHRRRSYVYKLYLIWDLVALVAVRRVSYLQALSLEPVLQQPDLPGYLRFGWQTADVTGFTNTALVAKN